MDQISRGRLHWRRAPVSCYCPAKPSVAEELFLDVPDALMAYAPLNANHRQYKDQGNKAGYPPETKAERNLNGMHACWPALVEDWFARRIEN